MIGTVYTVPMEMTKIGKGSYGQVYQKNKNTVVKECDKYDRTGLCGTLALELSTITELSILNIDELEHTPKIKEFQTTSDNKILISMENGGQTLLQFSKTLNMNERLQLLPKFAFQLIKSCLYFQENGIVHNDIKSANVLVNGSNDIKLIDFGLCAFETINKPNGVFTSYGTSMSQEYGTYTICPPETFMKNHWSVEKYMPWSIGITLCEFVFQTHSVICECVCTDTEKELYKQNYSNDWMIKQVFADIYMRRLQKGQKTIIDFSKYDIFSKELTELFHSMLTINMNDRKTLRQLYNLPIFNNYRKVEKDNAYLGVIATLHCNIVPKTLVPSNQLVMYKDIRGRIINHIFDIYCSFNKLNLFLHAVHIFDKYCSVKVIEMSKLCIAGIASAYIAQYIEKRSPIPLATFTSTLAWIVPYKASASCITAVVEDILFTCCQNMYSQTFDVQIAKTTEAVNMIVVLDIMKTIVPPYNNNVLVKEYVSRMRK
jgi:serine/threonine protein kinase